jgi:NAD+ synthase
MSLEDAQALADALQIRYDIMPIAEGMESVEHMLAALHRQPGEVIPDALAQENLQSRLRGLLLMAISNSTGALLLTTGNKSELAVGYATLYGDMCGAFSVLKDIYKTDVFRLARWRNAHQPEDSYGAAGAVMPERIITRPPSAELRADQRDEDSLPPYDVLDAILKGLIEERRGLDALVADGYARETVQRVAHLLRRSEYKRRQAPPGVKLSPLSFGKDWRMPLTNRFSG